MSHNYYSEINLHVVWHTKLSRALLTPEVEPFAWSSLREKAQELGDVVVHEIGGTQTHVHLAISIEPTVKISDLVGALKGYSAHEVNRRVGLKQKVLQWQTGYGVVSFWVVGYVRNQKQHHARNAAHERLERIHRFDEASPEAEADDREAP
jgi:putative transposase